MAEPTELITKDEFSSFIQYHRLAIHMSRRQFAEMMDVSPHTYTQWENGTRMAKDPYKVIAVVRNIVKQQLRSEHHAS